MKNLPYEQNLKQRRDLLQNYQKEMADLNDKKIIDKKNKLAEERQYIERMNQKFEEEKMLQQNIKSSKANEKMLEYKQFIQKKQEEKDLKRGQRNTFIEEPIFSKEKQRYLSSNPTTNQAFIPISGNPNQYQSNNIPSNSNIQGNYRSPNETPNKNEYGQSNYIQNIGLNNHNLTPQNNIYNNQPQENQDPKSHNNIYNKQPQENQDPMSHNNIYNNQPQENQDPRSHNKEMQDNYNQGPELPQELKNPDFSDPNFDYIKYDEMMQNYAKQYLMKEDERKLYENENRQSDKNSVDEISFQMKNNLNVNTPNQDPYENEKFNPNRKDPNQTGEIQNNINQNQMMTNPYQNEFNSNTNLEKPNYSNENQYNQIISKSENRSNISNQGGITPQDNYSRSNIPQNYEETYTKDMQNQPDNPYQRNPNDNINYMQYNNANNYVNSNQKFSENRSQSRDPKQNNIDQSTNSINPYQYTQLNYLRNKSNNQVSSITNSNYNFEKVNNNNIRNNYNKNTFNNTQDNENNVEKIQQQNNSNLNQQYDFNNLLKNKKYEQQMQYKNFLDSQVKDRSNFKDNFKVNEFIGLNKKDRNLQTNPYTNKKYEFGHTNLNNNIITPQFDYSKVINQGQMNPYQERPVIINNNANNNPMNNNNNSFNRPSSGKLQIVGNNIMK